LQVFVKRLPCPPWCDSESKMLMQSKAGLGQGRDVLKSIY
jgi:hypothetical protein